MAVMGNTNKACANSAQGAIRKPVDMDGNINFLHLHRVQAIPNNWLAGMRKPVFLPLMLVIISGEAQAEVLDKAGGSFAHWYLTLICLAVAVLLAWWRPWLALLVYPFSLLLASSTLDFLHGELGRYALQEGGMPFLISAYASVLADLSGPVIAFALFRRR